MYFLVRWRIVGVKCGYWQQAALPISFYIVKKNYHHEHATEPTWLPNDIAAAWDAVSLCFHGVSSLYKY